MMTSLDFHAMTGLSFGGKRLSPKKYLCTDMNEIEAHLGIWPDHVYRGHVKIS